MITRHPGLPKMEVEYSINIEDINIAIYQARLHMTLTEAVLIPANPNLLHFEGGAKEVSVLAGPGLIEEIESRFPRPLPVGEAVATHGHNTKHKYILHCVIPHNTKKVCSSDVRMALMDSIALALCLCEELEVRSLALPLLGNDGRHIPTGLFAECLVEALEQFVAEHEENRILSIIHIVDIDRDAIETLKNLLSLTFKIRLLPKSCSECAGYTVTPTRGLLPTSSAVIIVVSKEQIDLIRERVIRVYSNEYKVRSVGPTSVFLTNLRQRQERLVKDVVYVKAPRNTQTLHVFKMSLLAELKTLLECGRRNISLVVEKDALFVEKTNIQTLTADNVRAMLEDGMENLL